MLVLALQFSKGIAGVGTEHHRNGVVHRTRRGSGAELVPGEKGGSEDPAPSKRKRRQSLSSEIERRTDPTTLEHIRLNPPMHQLGTGSNRVGRMPTND